MESLRQSSIRRCILAPGSCLTVEGRGGDSNVNALTSSLGGMMLNSLTLLDEGILSSGFCLGGVCSAEGGGINVVEGKKRRSRAKERNAEKGTAGSGKHFRFCFLLCSLSA